MFDNNASLFRQVAMGTAAENKLLGSVSLTITPHEHLPFIDGELVNKVDTLEYEGKDISGNVSGGNAFVSNDIVATWLPDSNRKTAPDVRRGERVSLWQYANNDKYYWRSMAMDERLRRLETVVFAINANPSESQTGDDPEDMYFFEWSSHSKTITLSTSQKNGEFCTYDLQLDLKNGKFVIQDNLGNHGFIDSKNTHIKLMNAADTFMELNKQNAKINAPRDIELIAANDISLKGKRVIINGGGSVMTLESSGTTLKTPKFIGSE